MENISQLISDYLEGELDAAGAARLAELLRQDPAAVDQLVLDSFIHLQLHDWLHVRPLRDELLLGALRDRDRNACDSALAREEAEETTVRRTSRRRWLTASAASAAMLAITASLITAAYFATRPAVVAQLTQATHCQWESHAAPYAVGALLHAGEPLTLQRGRAVLTFTCGARITLEGPAAVELASAAKVSLHSGRVGALVPTHAVGFSVATPRAEFVDLGTEFALALKPSGSCELQVFDGMVEMRLPPLEGRAAEKLRISQGSAIRFDAATADVRSIPYDKEQRLTP